MEANSPQQSNQRHIADDNLDLLRETPVLPVAEHLGIELDRHGRGPCVLCGTSPRSQAFSIDRKRPTKWRCFSCNEHGDAIALVRGVVGCSFREAASIVADVIGVDLGRPPDPQTRRQAEARRLERDADRRREWWRRQAAHAVADMIHAVRRRRRILTQYPHVDREQDLDDLAHLADAEARLIYLHELLTDRDEAVADAALERIIDVDVPSEVAA